MNKPALVLFLMALPFCTAAGDDYRCVIKRVHAAVEDNPTVARERKMYVGKEFTVDRKSGAMVGVLKNSYISDPVVVDHGSKDNSFKAITTMRKDQGVGAGSSVSALVINEYVDSASKPFVFLSNETVYFGNCTNF